jgi:hypothetical protein
MGPWFEASRSERIGVIHEEIDQLPLADRTALIVCGLERRPVVQAGKELGCGARTLERRVSRALERVRLRLARRYYGVPAGNWDSDITQDLGAIVPLALIESTVAVVMRSFGPPRSSQCLSSDRTLNALSRFREGEGSRRAAPAAEFRRDVPSQSRARPFSEHRSSPNHEC